LSREEVATTATRSIARPTDQVWAVLRRFEDLSCAFGLGGSPLEATGSGVGMLRIATAPRDRGRIVEKLTALDDSGMSIKYVIVGGGIPSLSDHAACAQVLPHADGCEIRWHCRASVDADEAKQGQAILAGMADRMAEIFASQFES
jgi:carbon monoxide dehydrogenase subunit G